MEPGEQSENGVEEPPAPDAEGEVTAEMDRQVDFAVQPAADVDVDAESEDVSDTPSALVTAPPVLLSLDELSDDQTFRFRPDSDVSLLATDLARLGQLYPIDVRPLADGTYQVVCGFRRVDALRFLQRERVLAQVHESLEDEDALLRALAAAVHAEPVSAEALRALQERLDGQGWLTAPVKDLLEKALAPDTLSPESNEVEVDADELAVDVTLRLGGLNQDLALVAEVFGSLERERREELLQQLRYAAELVAYLESRS